MLVAGIFYLRLAQGPVSLDFMRAAVENRINASLPDMSVSLGGVVIERSDEAFERIADALPAAARAAAQARP